MTLEIRPLDVQDDVALRHAYDVRARSALEGREGRPFLSWPEYVVSMRAVEPGAHSDVVGGYVDGTLVGLANTWYGTLANLDKSWIGVDVDPAQRRRGHGRALLDHVCDLATAAGRSTLVAGVCVTFDELQTHPYRRFAEAAGFTLSHAEVVRELELPLDADLVASWIDETTPHTTGYRIETFVDDVPAELLESLCLLHAQLDVDAPSGDIDWEEEVFTPEMFLEDRRNRIAAGRTVLETLAIAPDGVVAAFSSMTVPPLPRTDVGQGGTFVHREHRGHRLGLATKAVNLRHLQRTHPRSRRITTANAETNQWMIAINERMGFEPVEVNLDLVRRT